MDHKLPVDFPKLPKKSVPYCCALRENGFYSKCNGPPKYLQWAAEDKLVTRNHEEFGCKLPDVTKSVFLMVFSPDGKKIASTHGNHNVYVTDLTNRKNVMTLSGHPRTPWCIAFHPSSNQILASGCLGGQVRVWDLHGGSEIWSAESHTVIASLAFHPIDRVLVIASYNELHFWDWSQQKPFAKCSTDNEKEKVRYVAFDQLGHKLITGIANAPHAHSQWDRVSAPQPPPQTPQTEHERRITICYRYMVEQYEQLVQRYFDISRRSALTAATAERGTDPMEHDEENRQERGGGRSEPRTSSARDDGAVAGPSRGIMRSRHSAMGTDEISASHSSSQFLSSCFFPRQNSRTIANNSLSEPSPSRTEDSNDSHPLGHIRSHSFVGRRCSGVGSSRITPPPRMEEISSPQSDRLWERLHHLRAQVESGRQILATARSATAAITARMSPSAPEDANFLIENLLPSDWTSVSPSNFAQHGTRGRSNSSSSLPPGSDFQNSDRSSNISTQNNDLGTVADGNLRTYWRENNALPLLIDLSRSSDLPTRVVRPNPLNSSLHSHEHGRSQDDLYISTIPNLVPPLPPPPPPPPPLPPPPLPLRSSAPSQNRPGSSGENPFLKRLGTLFRLSRIENLGDAQDLRTTNNRNPNSISQTSPSSSTHKRNSNVKRLSSRSNSERSDLSQRSLQNSASGSRSNPEEQASNHSSVSSNSLSKNIASGLARLYVAESAEATINALETMNGRRLTAEEIHLIERSKKTKAPVQEIASSSNVARSSGTFSRSNTDEQSTSSSEQSSSSTSRALTMEEWTNMNPENLTLEESIPVWESFFGRSLAPGEAEAILRFRRQVVTGSDSVNRANGSLTRRQVVDTESPSISGSTSSSSISAPPRVEPSNQSLSNGASSRTNRGEQSTNNAEPSSSSSSRVLTAEEWASMNPEELEESIPLWESFFGRSLAPGEAEAILRLRRYGTARTDALNVRCPNGSLTSSQADSSVPSTSTAPLSERILRRVSDTIATVRLRTELRRLQHTYQHGENEQASHLLNEDAEAAERRLLMRFRSPNNRLFTLLPNGVPLAIGTPNRCASLYNSPDDLRNIRSGIMFFSIHINEMFKLCRNVRADAVQLQQIERLWEDLQSQISALHRIVRDEPIPIAEDLSMRGGRGTGVGIGGAGAGTSSESGAGPSESGASTEPTSSLNTDDDSDGEGSSSGLTGGPGPRRQLFSFRRFRFLQRSPRASAAKRARYESAVRAAEGLSRVHRPRTRPQTNRDSSSGQTTGTDEASDDTGEEGNMREHPRPGQSGTEQPKTELPKPEQPKPEQPRPEQSKSEQSRPQQSRPQQSRPQQSRPQQSRLEQSRPEQFRPEQSTPEHSTPEQSTPGQSRPEQHRANTSTSALPSSTSHSGVGERGVPYRRKERLHVFHLTPPSEYGGRVNRLILQPGSNRARLCQARVNRYRVNLGQQPRFWQRIPSYRSQPSQSTRDFSSQTPPFTQDAAVGTGSESSSQSNSPARDCLRRRTRNVLLLMVDSLTQFFENDKIYRRVSTEMLHERITNLHSLLQLAVKLTELLLSQPELSRRESEVRSANYRTLRFQREGFRRFLRRSLDGPSERVVSGPSRRSHSLLSGSVRGHRVPILRVNDGPVPSETPPPLPRDPGDRRDPPLVFPPSNVMTAHWRPRFLHPRYMGPNPFEESTEDSSSIERENFLFMRGNGPTSVVLTDTPTAPHHRIQAWDFSKYQLPEIHNATKNIVVSECKIHNDASVDLSSDGTLLVTLLPSGRLSITTMLGIYSLQWETLGQCLYTTSFEQNAVSVSLSPTTRHLIVGLASKRLNMFSIDRHTIAQVMKLEGGRPGRETGVPSKGRLVFVRDIELDRDIDFMSLNCIRWIPTPGAGFVYGTNTGLLKILR